MHVNPTFRIGALAAGAVAATLLAAGCSTGTSKAGGSSPTHSATSPIMTAAQVIQSVSSQAKRATSATAVLDVQSTGKMNSSMHGTMKVRTQPSVAFELDVTTLSAQGQSIPGGMDEILDSKGIYIKLPQLTQATGKPWVHVSASDIGGLTGNSFSSLTQGIQQDDPLSAARMMAATNDVQAVGKSTVGGVSTTDYHGTYSMQRAFALLPPRLQKLESKAVASMHVGDITFDAFVDSQNDIRQVTESFDSLLGHTTVSMRFTSIDQPVTITAPPAIEIGAMPTAGM